MGSAFTSGNDLTDNYSYVRWSGHIPGTSLVVQDSLGVEPEKGEFPTAVGWSERVLQYRFAAVRHSNLLRIVKYRWGPLLRSLLVPSGDERRLIAALALTGAELGRLDRLSKRYAFAYTIYVLHPVQDIMRGSFMTTTAQLDSVAPGPVHTTGVLFEKDPPRYYFPYDGHLNPEGSRRVAEFLVNMSGR